MDNLSPQDVFDGSTVLQKIVDELENCFPPINPTPDTPHSKIMYLAGQRSVVEFLLAKLTQEKNDV